MPAPKKLSNTKILNGNEYLAGLNDGQQKAVMHTHGPLLVLAGAGSGKTRVLTTRITRFVKQKVCTPQNILALTFTNKAAREMRERISKLVGTKAAADMTVSTFHSLGARILREDGEVLGIKTNFTIMDDHDRTSAIKTVMRSVGRSGKDEDHAVFAHAISMAKNAGLDPEQYQTQDEALRKTSKIYKAYRSMSIAQSCIDFDDLLLFPLRIFEKSPEVLEKYRKRYTFVSIDEFQDTNAVQMRFAQLLAAPENNIMVVGDDDQSIYSWRGAIVDNIIDFPVQFKGCTTVILDKNYRSSRQILDGAHAIVAKNTRRTRKTVTSQQGDGDPIMHFTGDDEEDEADWIAQTIKKHGEKQEFAFRDHALLFRTNIIMRRFEEALRRERVPYKTVGAASFFDRKEVKDILAYMRFFVNPDDELSFMRVLKVPEKNISKETIESIDAYASARKISLWKGAQHVQVLQDVNALSKSKVQAVVDLCNKYFELLTLKPQAATFTQLMHDCGYMALAERAFREPDGTNERYENILELLRGFEAFEAKRKGADLADYLRDLTLLADDTEKDDATASRSAVTLMTMHKSKGLEFPCVILGGLDDAIIPSPRTIEEGNMDEERRLFYVAMTRAKKRLILTFPKTKLFRQKTVQVKPCRFVFEIPEEFLDGPIGEKEQENYQEFMGDFFKQMQEQLAPKVEVEEK